LFLIGASGSRGKKSFLDFYRKVIPIFLSEIIFLVLKQRFRHDCPLFVFHTKMMYERKAERAKERKEEKKEEERKKE
jgi:hypothetical protein